MSVTIIENDLIEDQISDREAADRYILEEQIGFLLRQAHQRHSAIYQEEMRDSAITRIQYAALIKLYNETEVSQNELGILIGTDPSGTLKIVRRLSKSGFIACRDAPDDKRRSLWRLTDLGYAAVLKHAKQVHKIAADTLAPLTAEEQLKFLQLIKKLT